MNKDDKVLVDASNRMILNPRHVQRVLMEIDPGSMARTKWRVVAYTGKDAAHVLARDLADLEAAVILGRAGAIITES